MSNLESAICKIGVAYVTMSHRNQLGVRADPGAEVRPGLRGAEGRAPGVQQGQLRDHPGPARAQGRRLLQG
ncbi:jg11781 [Pararge aegeria aegeria]|uniref:Jg11781 protein n=1 Tax=Pararge aegeria aegeria TaxID=348720 RepID=A0A8S4S421_9NEOP|nr:jg11781 [Pararge aegeria aegeria]